MWSVLSLWITLFFSFCGTRRPKKSGCGRHGSVQLCAYPLEKLMIYTLWFGFRPLRLCYYLLKSVHPTDEGCNCREIWRSSVDTCRDSTHCCWGHPRIWEEIHWILSACVHHMSVCHSTYSQWKKRMQLVKYWKSVTGRGSTAYISMAFNGFCPGIHTRYAATTTTTLSVFQFYLQNAPTFRWSVILLAHWSEEFSLLISIPTTYKNVLGHKSTDQAVMYSCSFFLFSW